MNIDDLTLGQVKGIAEMFGGAKQQKAHPLLGQRVLVILPHGFVYFGNLNQRYGELELLDACNVRYWEKREGGLPEFADSGPSENDKIDRVHTSVIIGQYVAMIECGDWRE